MKIYFTNNYVKHFETYIVAKKKITKHKPIMNIDTYPDYTKI